MKIGNFDVLPPKEAYSYHPPPGQCLIETEYFVERLVFSNQELKEWEKVMLEQLDRHLSQNNLQLSDQSTKLRFLYGQGWNIPQTFEALNYHLKWKQEWPPHKSLIPLLQPLLTSGGVYIHGRDKFFRPAIIICPSKLMQFPYHLHLAACYFLLEFILETMLIPGQIENWVLIVDLKNYMISNFLVQKKFLSELFTHYPCRIGKIYLFRGDKGLCGLNKFLTPNTLYKVQVVEKKNCMLNDFEPGQLEVKYGGSVRNIKAFWPLSVVGASFRGMNDSIQEFISTNSSYREYFQGNAKICSDLSSLKASLQGEKESFISNNDFRDEVWQRLELISASYSFLALERLGTQENEEKKEKSEKKNEKKEKRNKLLSEEMTLASTCGPNRMINDETEIPFACNICNSDCLIF
ncbi:hypothetical protein SteCoe_23913 [Stentor coeruleus]|uniref:CRAL-TRIO domain-containing protein n=1 Tax=Stentor coeruleus TaxID=5963 RepID=A0A1R2BJ81_9CILI|nr:hypothetical protein SteCoe_23913 [Stentor coeruleus]